VVQELDEGAAQPVEVATVGRHVVGVDVVTIAIIGCR